jgi:hypothetical protein
MTNELILRRRNSMANKYKKKHSTSLAIKEMQIKTTLRSHLTPVRLAVLKEMNKKHAGKDAVREPETEGTLIHCWWEDKLVQPSIETGMEVPQNTKSSLTF